MRIDPSQTGASALSSLLAKADATAAREGGAFATLLQQGAQAQARTSAPGAARSPLGSAQLFAEPTRVATAPLPAATSREAADKRTTPRGERTKPVEGRKYEEIVAGPRNGMFVNRSGNERDGIAFLKVTRNHREFHVYGSGEDRLIVEVRPKPKAAPPAPAATTPAPGSAPTQPAPPAVAPTPPPASPGGLGNAPQANPSRTRPPAGIPG